jgi:TetR/AcrR family transcriptional regulator
VTSPSSALALQRIALEQFAAVGFAGASLGSIAHAAGLAKSSVLYHYASKEALLTAAVQPAVDALAAVVDSYPDGGGREERELFVERFIDFLLDHRLALHLFINQGQSLHGVPALDRANALVQRFGDLVSARIPSTGDRIRFGVALGGAAYTLVAAANWSAGDLPETAEVRAALVDAVSALLSSPAPLAPAP